MSLTESDESQDESNESLSGDSELPRDTVGLLEGLMTTRAIRRYTSEPIPPAALRTILFAATRAPTGTNRQTFRFIVLTDGPVAQRAKALIGENARAAWANMRARDGYDRGSGSEGSSPKARMARAMQDFTDGFERIPVLILPCLIRRNPPSKLEGASIFPACQNILLAARGLGYGGVFTGYNVAVEDELRELLEIPPEIFMAGTITLGRPVGNHGPVRRRPMAELVFAEKWGDSPDWAIDPAGTRYTSAGPPRPIAVTA
jgi:nitroreductase